MKGQIKVTAKDDSVERKGVRRERQGMDCRLQGKAGNVGRNDLKRREGGKGKSREREKGKDMMGNRENGERKNERK